MLARLLFIWMFLVSAQVLASTEGMYIHTDGLGSPVAKSDKNGNYISGSRTRYEPYGATAAGATPTIGFTGHVNDADTGLIYMQQRYYDPYAGRFLSTDPVLTDANTGSSFNRYVYANNSPYKYVDPDGRFAIAGGGVVATGVVLIGAHQYANNPQFRASTVRLFNAVVSVFKPRPTTTGPLITGSSLGGNRGTPMDIPPGTNPPATIGGRDYTGHAQDQMQGRGVPPSAVEEAIANGTVEPSRGDTSVYTDSKNGVRVVVNADGKVVTVITIGQDKGGQKGDEKKPEPKDEKPPEESKK